MTLTVELSQEEEARLEIASRSHGTDPVTYAKQLVTEHLPATVPTVEAFQAILGRLARTLPVIPADKQTREYIYED